MLTDENKHEIQKEGSVIVGATVTTQHYVELVFDDGQEIPDILGDAFKHAGLFKGVWRVRRLPWAISSTRNRPSPGSRF